MNQAALVRVLDGIADSRNQFEPLPGIEPVRRGIRVSAFVRARTPSQSIAAGQIVDRVRRHRSGRGCATGGQTEILFGGVSTDETLRREDPKTCCP